MTTTVGKETAPEELVSNLISLEHDALAAYDVTIDKLEDAGRKARIAAFREDHLAHLDKLKAMAAEIGAPVPEAGDLKAFLTTGKVKLAGLMGEDAALRAMKTNEDDTVQAYRQAAGNAVAPAAWKPFLEKAMADEERHRAWMEGEAS